MKHLTRLSISFSRRIGISNITFEIPSTSNNYLEMRNKIRHPPIRIKNFMQKFVPFFRHTDKLIKVAVETVVQIETKKEKNLTEYDYH